VEDILASGSALTAAACPFCITMLRDGLADCGSTVEVKDIVELVDSATGPGHPARGNGPRAGDPG
jgi:Fe-S oxidoreductase